MKFDVTRAVCAMAITLGAADAASAVNFIEGTINPNALVRLGAAEDSEAEFRSRTTSPGNLFASASAALSDNTSSVTALSGMNALWFSANAGRVEHRVAFTSTNVTSGAAFLNESTTGDWTYKFKALSDGVFSFRWTIAVDAENPNGLIGWKLDWGSDPLFLSVFDPPGTGSFEIEAGQLYTVRLFSQANLSGELGKGNAEATLDWFEWSITESVIPEPGTWALMLVGFGAIGFAVRRQRNGLSGAKA